MKKEDENFLALWEKTSEYEPSHPMYPHSKTWNLSAVERGHRYADVVERYMPLPGKRALDVGCGSGGVSIAFAERGAICTALEPSDVRWSWARTRIGDHGVEVDLRKETLESTEFGNASFDVITAIDVLEHVTHYRPVMDQMCDLLAEDGILFASVPNCLHIRSILSEPHSGLFGVLLLPVKLRPFYVVKVRRRAKSFPVSHFPPAHALVGICRAKGLQVLEPPLLRRVLEPGNSEPTVVRRVLRFSFVKWLAIRLVSWFRLSSSYWLIARKRSRQMLNHPQF